MMAKYIPFIKLWVAFGNHNPMSIHFSANEGQSSILHKGVRFYGFGFGTDRFIFGLIIMPNKRETEPHDHRWMPLPTPPKETP